MDYLILAVGAVGCYALGAVSTAIALLLHRRKAEPAVVRHVHEQAAVTYPWTSTGFAVGDPAVTGGVTGAPITWTSNHTDNDDGSACGIRLVS